MSKHIYLVKSEDLFEFRLNRSFQRYKSMKTVLRLRRGHTSNTERIWQEYYRRRDMPAVWRSHSSSDGPRRFKRERTTNCHSIRHLCYIRTVYCLGPLVFKTQTVRGTCQGENRGCLCRTDSGFVAPSQTNPQPVRKSVKAPFGPSFLQSYVHYFARVEPCHTVRG
jgi:hypothetical protein